MNYLNGMRHWLSADSNTSSAVRARAVDDSVVSWVLRDVPPARIASYDSNVGLNGEVQSLIFLPSLFGDSKLYDAAVVKLRTLCTVLGI